MAQPKAPDIMRPDLVEKYKQQMSAAVDKLNKHVKQPWKAIGYTDKGPRFKITHRDDEPFSGQIVVQLIDVNTPIFGYILSATELRLTVCLIGDEPYKERVIYENYHHAFKTVSYTRHLLFSTMKIEDFIELVDEKVKEERNLDKRAKITNREVRQMKEDIQILKRDVYKLLKEHKEEQEQREFSRQLITNLSLLRNQSNDNASDTFDGWEF